MRADTLLRTLAWVRLGLALLVLVHILRERHEFPPGYEAAAWIVLSVFVALGAGLLLLAYRWRGRRRWPAIASVVADAAVATALIIVFSFEDAQPLRMLLFLVILEAALFFGLLGGVAAGFASAPLLILAESWRVDRLDFEPDPESVLLRTAVGLVLGAVVGWLVHLLVKSTRLAEERAAEAESLRDQLGRRVDVLEAANRAARALGSSLELEEAFQAFIREVRGLVPFDRIAIVLVEEGDAHVIATAGAGADDVFPPGAARPVQGSVLEEVLTGQVVYREDISDARYPEERELLALGLRCRLVAPLLLGARTVGILSLSRNTPRSFSPEEVELVSLLGRLVATGVQNIRAYELERSTVEELRRLSALRADFVSLVSHELRSPMAAVIGSARTLQQRWRELAPEQRESFLNLIAGETTRLAALIGDVLDTSRIEAGTFSYAFTDVDLGRLVRDAVASATVGQDEVELVPAVTDPLPHVRGDEERLRQVLTNLIDNAVKYSPAGGEVRVAAYPRGGRVVIEVADSGPGIAREQQGVIFEKFGRATGDGAKPGTGLGLFIARSIAEAHGGSLEVRSAPERGATFTLALPAV